jgi:PPOX class probable F420-dependent enzyme
MPNPPLPDELDQVLARPNPSIIGSVTPDGAPNTVATWYVWDDGRVLVNMDEGRKRLEYLRQNPRVSITVLDGDSWYRHISLQGTVTLQADTDLADIDRLSRHYSDKPYPNRERPRVTAWLDIDNYHAWG